ncbi:MAG: prepilin-type N-terminal cleavage/methylation domain-containing protein [Nitrospirota bacterium]
MQRDFPRPQAGFTLIELVIIILIIGVLTIFALPKFDQSGAQVAAVAKKLTEDLRYAQGRAVATQIPHGVVFSGCTGGNCTQYRIAEFDAAGMPTVSAKDPLTGQDFVVEMTGPFDQVILDTTLPNQQAYFDWTGSPFAGPGVTLTAATNAITVQAGVHNCPLTITVTTGLITPGSCS